MYEIFIDQYDERDIINQLMDTDDFALQHNNVLTMEAIPKSVGSFIAQGYCTPNNPDGCKTVIPFTVEVLDARHIQIPNWRLDLWNFNK